MNTKNLFTFAGVAYGWYAVMIALVPQGFFNSLYPDLGQGNLDVYFAGTLLGLAVACLMMRSHPSGPGATALLVAITIDWFLALYQQVRSVMAEGFTPIGTVDLVVALILGVGGAYLLLPSPKGGGAQT